MLREGHCKRNKSRTGGQRHEKMLKLKNIVHFGTMFPRFSREWELHVNANETRTRDM